MKILVCIKYVPDTSEVEVTIDETGCGVNTDRFSFDINDADNYAVEEAILLKEQQGGEVIILSLGPEDSEIMIRTALAKGADRAIRIDDRGISSHDPIQTARILSRAVPEDVDLVLTGCMANDFGYMAVGVALAQMLEIPHAAMIKKLDVLEEKRLQVARELEGGLMEVIQIHLPCLLTIQTGINEPRYASIRGIRQARKKELLVKEITELGRGEDTKNHPTSITLEKLFIPDVVSTAEFLEGDPGEKAARLAQILVKEGLM